MGYGGNSDDGDDEEPPQRRLWPILVVALVIVGLIVGLALALFPPEEEQHTAPPPTPSPSTVYSEATGRGKACLEALDWADKLHDAQDRVVDRQGQRVLAALARETEEVNRLTDEIEQIRKNELYQAQDWYAQRSLQCRIS